ncbi:cupin domain-containing protein [Belnapia rosea]|uniref:cupin domain-containing protein n=1 Tax=Belnapia rosea TaxID=938405 RepID=UPI0008871098|nr:cupin domain-containing protein [Belnapia rosea]SDB36757.1 ChrR Cupin-like domain-containing protein [Belnapia rosea]
MDETMDPAGLMVDAKDIEAVPFEIPGATGGSFLIQILNQDVARGVVTTIVHLPAGSRIPAHFHRGGPEMHYILEGDLIEAGEALGPGAFLTHAAGTVHGPHESQGGAKVLTVQQWQSHDGQFDFHAAEEQGRPAAAPPPGGTAAAALPPDPTAPNPDTRDAEQATG